MDALEAARRAVEQACLQFANPATHKQAEEVLLRFRQTPRIAPACKHILDASTMPEAQLHAALTLREAVLREWAFTPPEQVQEVRRYLLEYLMRKAGTGSSAVLQTIAQALAVIFKRGWLAESTAGRAAFFAELEGAAAAGSSGLHRRRLALLVLREVVTEFNPRLARPMGLAWEQHEACRAQLEERWLPEVFRHAAALGREVVASGLALRGGDAGVFAEAVLLLQAVLSWDFRRGSVPGLGTVGLEAQRGDFGSLQPGPAWRELLLHPGSMEWLPQLLLEGTGGEWARSEAAEAARRLVLLLCSLSGAVFPDDDRDAARLTFLSRMLRVAMAWTCPAQQVVPACLADPARSDELLSGCEALAALAAHHSAASFQRVADVLQEPLRSENGGAPQRAGSAVFQHLAQLLSELVRAGGAREGGQDGSSWPSVGLQKVMEAWLSLVAPGALLLSAGSSARESARPSPEMVEAAGAAFEAFARGALEDAAAGAMDEDEEDAEGEDVREDWRALAASLARAALPRSLQFLGRALVEQRAVLDAALARPWTGANVDAVQAMEKLCWLQKMAAHVLADSGEGETPMVPIQVLMALEGEAVLTAGASVADVAAALEQLSCCLLTLGSACLQERARSGMSPRLLEASVWSLARWADTYVLPQEHGRLPALLQSAFCEQAPDILDSLVRIGVTCLINYPGEVQLHSGVCDMLLPKLVHRSSVCRLMCRLPPLQELASAFAARHAVLRTLRMDLQRSLAFSLCSVVSGMDSAEEARAFLTGILQPVASATTELATRPDLDKIVHRADILQEAMSLLETLRGAAKASSAGAPQETTWHLMAAMLPHIAALFRACADQAAVTVTILKLAAELVDAHISFLQVQEVAVLCEWTMELVSVYKSSSARRSAQIAALAGEAERDKYRDLRALLGLLVNLTNRDLLSDSGSGSPARQQPQQPEQRVDIAQVVFSGLDLLIPLMSGELLRFPKLARQYYELLAYMLEVYTDRIALLPDPQFATLMQTLEYGLKSLDLLVAQRSLEGLAALARWHCTWHKQSGAASPLAGRTLADAQQVLPHFMRVVLLRLLFEDTALDLVALAADALFPLMLSEPQQFQQLGQRLLAGQSQDTAAQAALAAALNALLESNGLKPELDRQNRLLFRKNLSRFVTDARGIVRTT